MKKKHRTGAVVTVLALVVGACSGTGVASEETQPPSTSAQTTTTTEPDITTTVGPTTSMASHADHSHDAAADQADIVAATLATAAFQDVASAEAAGYGNTMEALGCFEDAEAGGMGLHYLREDLLDDVVDIAEPEALVYELDADGEVVGLIAHEYIVPVEAWTSDDAPSLFGQDFHQHPVLPLWVLHVWLWKDNPAGMFVDFNPKVRMCPEGVPIFGVDLP